MIHAVNEEKMDVEKFHSKWQSLAVQHQKLIESLSNTEENARKEKIRDAHEECRSFSLEQKHIIEKIRSTVRTNEEPRIRNGDMPIIPKIKIIPDTIREDAPNMHIRIPKLEIVKEKSFKPIDERKIAKHEKKSTSKKKPPSFEQYTFLEKLGLVSQEKYAELKCKQSDRKRRTRNLPSYLLLFSTDADRIYTTSPESSDIEDNFYKDLSPKRTKKENASKSIMQPDKKKRRKENYTESAASSSTMITSIEGIDVHDFHETICSVCRDAGNLLMCDTCDRVYHLSCLDPPLSKVPPGTWFCPKCLERLKGFQKPDLEELKRDEEAFNKYKQEVELERQKALKNALEIRRQRHNYGIQIKQFTASIASQEQTKRASKENIEQLNESLSRLRKFMTFVKPS